MKKVVTFGNGLEFRMTDEDARLASHQGQCDEDVKALIECEPYIQEQLAAIPKDKMVEELATYGAWTEEELAAKSHGELGEIIVWIAAGNINEGECYEYEEPTCAAKAA